MSTKSTYRHTVDSFKNALGLGNQTIETSLYERLIFYIALGLSLFVTLFPFYYMTVASLSPESSLYSLPPTLIPDELTLTHYRTVFGPETFPFLTYFKNSFIVATVTAGASVLVATFGAYSFARLDYKGRGIFSRGVLMVYMFSGILLVVPMFQVIVWLGFVDSLWSLFITYLVQTLPVSLYMLGNYFRSIPEEIEEAAIMDGYSRLEVIFKITLPLSAPAIVAVFFFTFMIAWNEYLFASIFLESQGVYTLPIGIEALASGFHQVWGEIMAASLLTSIPLIVMFMYLEKYMVEGLTFGAVEG
ncbi:ABC transporter permease [Natronococcus pandeyae]|uniref:ABC transporter permease n=1 Tax=Natronococcus pandeyae TaxID=2055836 RepID=A0A8J8TR78_9EURY|nr:carbohydrate ABC transporter permease [Natronococcus pandeyae]TYL37282.1 ABC transporter permease [Natronococcus pandeyae]